ncbi:MAG: tetratricopeptide repeat-containing sensor histidine kinase, partial [Ginsengibacter sp.]
PKNFYYKILFVPIYLFVFSNINCYSQTPVIDSLKRELHSGKPLKISTLFELCNHGESMPADSLAKYAGMAQKISIQNQNLHNKLESDFYIGESFLYKGMSDNALSICNEDLKEIKDYRNMFDVYERLIWNKIIALTKQRKIEESVNLCFALLKDADNNNDIFARVTALNNLGVNNNILGNRAEALTWFKDAYAAIKDTGMYNQFPLVFTNLAATYYNTKNYDSANFFLNKALVIVHQKQNLRSEADCFLLAGLMLSERNKIDSAEQMLKKAVMLQSKIGNVQFILVGMEALEIFYTQQKNYTKAIEYIRQAQAYSKKFHEPFTLAFYKDLANCYKMMKDYDAYGEAMDTLMMLKDSMYQKSKAEDLAKLEAQYELSSKEAFIARQQLQLLHKNILIAIIVFIVFLILGMVFFIYRYIRHKQKVALNEAEEKERKRIAADLHDNIGAYASAISDNIDDIESRKLISDNSFLLSLKNNAAEIISSLRDTIWAFNNDVITLTGISDRLKIYIQKISPSYPGIQISLEENISGEKKLSPIQALHTFRIIQEAIHNAVCHSDADKIIVHLSGSETFLDISVEDNGCGFEPDKKKNAGNGLCNMKARAEESGFFLAIAKNHPSGTVVHLTSLSSSE